MIHQKHPKTNSKSICCVNPLNTQQHQQRHWQLMPSDGSWCFQTSKGFRTCVSSRRERRCPPPQASKVVRCKGEFYRKLSTISTESECLFSPKNREGQSKELLNSPSWHCIQLALMLHVSCTPIRWSQPTSTTFGSTEEHHALSWINGKAPISH